MPDGAGSRERMIGAAARLLQRQGYPGTGLKQIVEESGAPRGSLYFHFPGGKEELAVAALNEACRLRFEAMVGVFRESQSAVAAFRSLIASARTDLVRSGFSEGCPIATVVLEMASTSDPLQRACSKAWRGWEGLFEARLREDGYGPRRARSLALTWLALLEGSLLVSRAYRSTEPLDAVEQEISAILSEPRTPRDAVDTNISASLKLANDNDDDEGRS